MKNRYSLTEVQLRVMYGLALKTGHRALVGRGHELKCNRITARALQELGLVETDARTRLSIGMMVHRTREGERDALALRHGAKSTELDWCPCCGAKIRTRFEWESEASS